MPASTSFPTSIADQVVYAANMAAKAQLPEYDLPQVVVDLVTEANDGLQAAAAKASDPATRTSGAIANRDVALKAFFNVAGRVVAILRTKENLNPEQLESIGVRPLASRRKSVPAPSEAPDVVISRVEGRTIYGELRRTARGRGKPADVAGAIIFTGTGPIVPTSMSGWTFAQSTTRTTFSVTMPPSETETIVWVSAFWQNARDESGPASQPISVKLASGGALPTEHEQPTPMRIAA